MDSSRLLAVVTDFESEYKDGLAPLLKELIQLYTTARDTPGRDNTSAIQEALRSLTTFVEESHFGRYPPSKTAVLGAIGGSDRVGLGFQLRLRAIMSVAGQTTAGIVAGLGELQTELEAFHKACALTRQGLQSLGVTPHTIPVGEFELGVLIPELLVDRKLGALSKELDVWNKIVRGFQEAGGAGDPEVTVAQLASGSYELYLTLGVVAAGLLSRTIDKVLEWYLKILEIRRRRLELAELGAPVAETNAVKKHERDFLDKEIRALAVELVKEVNPKIESARRNELETHLTISIRQIARFVDKGGTVEVDSAPPELDEPIAPEGEDATAEATAEFEQKKKDFVRLSSDFAKIQAILDAGRSLSRLPERIEPILQLTDGETGDEPADHPEKPKKKS